MRKVHSDHACATVTSHQGRPKGKTETLTWCGSVGGIGARLSRTSTLSPQRRACRAADAAPARAPGCARLPPAHRLRCTLNTAVHRMTLTANPRKPLCCILCRTRFCNTCARRRFWGAALGSSSNVRSSISVPLIGLSLASLSGRFRQTRCQAAYVSTRMHLVVVNRDLCDGALQYDEFVQGQTACQPDGLEAAGESVFSYYRLAAAGLDDRRRRRG